MHHPSATDNDPSGLGSPAKLALPLLLLLWLTGAASAKAETVTVAHEGFIRGGAYASHDLDEAATNYLHVKYSTNLDLARKSYFQFDLAGVTVDPESPATFTIRFTASNRQRVQLWGLNQAYPSFAPSVTWNTAQANELTSNQLLTNGPLTATRLGTNVLIPSSGTAPYSFNLPRLGTYLFAGRVTLALTGVEDAANHAGGLRLQRGQATLACGVTTNPPSAMQPTNYDIYLIAGQSNMDGRGRVSELTNGLAPWTQPQPDVWIYYANPGSATAYSPHPAYVTGWQTLGPGFAVAPGFTGTLPSATFGPELSFARTLADAQPTRRLALIKVSKGGTSLSGDWNPANGYLYRTFTNQVAAALQALTNTGATYTVRGLIWHQGESDTSGATEANYRTNMVRFIESVRRDLGIANLPFVIGEIATNKSAVVRRAQRELAGELPWVGFASADGLRTYEGTHFITADVLELGRRFAAALPRPTPRLNQLSPVGSNVVLLASGLALSTCRLCASATLSVPPAQWMPVASNRFDARGELRLTHPTPADVVSQFYLLEPL